MLIDMGTTIRTKEYKVFIDRLKKARHEAGLKQIDVASKFKRPQSYIARVESGEYRIDVIELKKFAKIYGKETNYFLKD